MRRTPFVTPKSGYQWGSPFIQFPNAYFSYLRRRSSSFAACSASSSANSENSLAKRRVILLEFMGIGLIVPYKFS